MDPLCINVNEQVELSQPVKERRGKWLLAGVGMGFFVGAVVGYGATTMHTSAAQIEGIESGIFKFQPGVDIVLEKNSMTVTCAKENHETDFGSALQKDIPNFVPLPGVLPNAPQTKIDAITSLSNRPKHGPTGLTIMNAGDSTFVPDMGRRSLMNALLLGSIAGPLIPVGGVLIAYLTPAKTGGGGGGTLAKDALGNEVLAKTWIADHSNGQRNLVQGLKGDATYLIVSSDKTLEKFAVNAVCTHLGCVVPWSKSLNKFACPCHGSQYDQTGKVVRGPAPLSLALAKVGDQDGKVVLSPWTETDFRDGKPPWWKP